MANGPLGGFMPTPPSPGQPPQVKLETSAESRGAFNKFLGTLPSNGAVAPIQTGVVASSTAPVSPVTSNVNIFQPQMSQMAPMAPMPMMPPAQPVQMMFNGGEVDDFGDPGISFDTSDPSIGEDVSLSSSDIAGGTFDDGDSGVSFADDSAGGVDIVTGGQPTETPGVIDTRPRTNITNVGPTSNLRFDPQFTADLLGRRFGDSNIAGFMSKDDFAQTRQGGASVAPVNLSTGLKTLANTTQQNQFVDPTEGIAPVTKRSGVAGTGRTGPVDLLGLGDLGFGGLGLGRPNELQELRSINRDLTNRLSDLQPEVNPASIPLAPAPNLTAVDRNLTGISGIGADLSSPQSRDVLDNQFTQIAGLNTIVPGAGGLPSIDTVADDLIQGSGNLAQRSGANINNPGNIRTGGNFDGEIGRTKDGFAIFDNMKSGVDAIGKLATTYGDKRNIDTVREFANRYSPVGENTPKQVAGKINVLSNALGVGPDEKVDFTDANVQAKLTPAIITSEIGANKTKDVANVLRGFSPSPLNVTTRDLNPNITSNVDQLATLDPIVQTQTTSQIPDVLPDISQEFRQRDPRTFAPFISGTTQEGPGGRFTFSETPGRFLGSLAKRIQLSPDVFSEGSFDIDDAPAPTLTSGLIGDNIIFPEFANLATTTQNISPENTAARIARNNRTINEIRADLGSRVPDTALETLAGRRDILPDTLFDLDTRTTEQSRVGDDFEPALTLADRNEADRLAAAQALGVGTAPNLANLQSRTALGGRGMSPTTNFTQGPQQSIVGDDEAFADLNLADIQGNINQERVADILNRPDRFKDTFKIGDVEFPNLIATLANKAGSFFDRRLFDGIVKKGLDAVVDPDTGRIIGAKDEFGNLIEGRDLEQFQPDDDADPITKFLRKATEDKKEEETEKLPNVIGGGTNQSPLEKRPTVVSSPFGQSTARFTPVGFDAGNLNDLIARITGVPTPRRLQEGGTVQAVDRFLSKVA